MSFWHTLEIEDFIYVFETERFMINIQLFYLCDFQNFVQNALRIYP